MKNILFILIFFPGLLQAQGKLKLDPVTNRYVYKEVFDSIPLPTNRIYSRAKTFFLSQSMNAKLADDIINSEILANFYLSPSVKYSKHIQGDIPVTSTWKIEIKPGKYRITISNIMMKMSPNGDAQEMSLDTYCSTKMPGIMGGNALEKMHKRVLEAINAQIIQIVGKLNESIRSKSHSENDW